MLSLRVKLIRSCFRQRAFNIVLKPAVNYSVAALSKPERCSPRLSLERSRIFIANMASTSSPSVVHSAAERVFSIQLPEGKAVLEYDVLPSGVLDYHHTEVPEACRGKGLAGILAKAAFDYAVESKKTVRLTCTYLQHYLTKHQDPAYLAIVEK